MSKFPASGSLVTANKTYFKKKSGEPTCETFFMGRSTECAYCRQEFQDDEPINIIVSGKAGAVFDEKGVDYRGFKYYRSTCNPFYFHKNCFLLIAGDKYI
jgi:hypothetical protein